MTEEMPERVESFLQVFRLAMYDSGIDITEDPDREDIVQFNCKITWKRLESALRAFAAVSYND